MFQFAIRAGLSGVVVALVATVARRSPALGALVAALPLVSILGMMWLWHDTHDPVRMAAHAGATFWLVIPSLPMFLLIPALLRRGVSFWPALGAGIALTAALYLATPWIGSRLGLRL